MTICRIESAGTSRLSVLLCLVTLLLPGCVKGMIEGDRDRSILRPDIIQYKTTTDTPKPKVKEVAPGPAAGKNPAAPRGGSLPPPPPVEQRLLPNELSPQSPEYLMPIPHPAPTPSPDKSPDRVLLTPNMLPAGQASEGLKAPASSGGPSRRLAAFGAPGMTCGDMLLSEDSVWRGAVLVTGVVTVAPQATLTIEPGTEVRFAGADPAASAGTGGLLLVLGRLVADGTKTRPILFASRYAEPLRGDWQGIVLLGSEKKNSLEECTLEGAEIGIDASYSTLTLHDTRFVRCGTGIRLQDTVFSSGGGSVVNCEVGMALLESDAELIEGNFSGNSRGVISDRCSLYLAGGSFTRNNIVGLRADHSRVKISGGNFSNNGSGLLLYSSQGAVSGNTIAENADCGIALKDSRIRVQGNRIIKNGATGLRVADGQGVAWGNSFVGNGGYDLVNDGREEFRAMANWWGVPAGAGIGRRIFDRQSDGQRGKVIYYPPLTEKPAP